MTKDRLWNSTVNINCNNVECTASDLFLNYCRKYQSNVWSFVMGKHELKDVFPKKSTATVNKCLLVYCVSKNSGCVFNETSQISYQLNVPKLYSLLSLL